MHSREKALSQLRKSMRSEDRGDELPMPVQKVSVMADSKEGLEEGLDKAEDILGETDDLSLPDLESDVVSDELPSVLDEESTEEDESIDSLLSQMAPEQLKALMMKIKSLV